MKILARKRRETISFSITSKIIKYLGINLPKTCPLKSMRCWRKKSKVIQTDGKAYHALGLEESIFLIIFDE